MKKIKSILNAKLLLAMAFISVSALGFSQITDENIGNQETPPEVRFDFMGNDLLIESPPGLNDMAGSKQKPDLKSAVFNPLRLDSILEMTNYGMYIERCKWQFDYDESNNLKTSTRLFFNAYYNFKGIKELRKYDENGQTLSVVRTKPSSLKEDSLETTYTEENHYSNGNLTKETKVQFPSSDVEKKLETTFSYNEKNQLSTILEVITTNRSSSITTYYLYDWEDRQEYKIQSTGRAVSPVIKYVYVISDTTLFIQEKHGIVGNYKTPSDLENGIRWTDKYTYLLRFDPAGRTKSIEKSAISNNISSFVYRVEYDYTASGKLEQTSFYLPDDPLNFTHWNASTIIKNTYDEYDNLRQYAKMFNDSVANRWIDEELQTYYYSSVKSVFTSNNQQKTDNLYIYPNPASEVIYLSASPEPGTSYAIYNSMGKTVSQGTLKSQSIQVSQLKPGMYFMKTIGTNAVSEFRFIKK